ncbi:hypothetical protein BDA99DRAFT_528147 [Phascolomyces articulosus]|uniref:Galactose oxidase n=1 Tax=Phascolomyces articulosus TaxID=60185 RepID=A0AAD5JMW5_9FUNG|nr:hypothetical protein BDA99DRAFT_528147 [Phascolomyces articulosus]
MFKKIIRFLVISSTIGKSIVFAIPASTHNQHHHYDNKNTQFITTTQHQLQNAPCSSMQEKIYCYSSDTGMIDVLDISTQISKDKKGVGLSWTSIGPLPLSSVTSITSSSPSSSSLFIMGSNDRHDDERKKVVTSNNTSSMMTEYNVKSNTWKLIVDNIPIQSGTIYLKNKNDDLDLGHSSIVGPNSNKIFILEGRHLLPTNHSINNKSSVAIPTAAIFQLEYKNRARVPSSSLTTWNTQQQRPPVLSASTLSNDGLLYFVGGFILDMDDNYYPADMTNIQLFDMSTSTWESKRATVLGSTVLTPRWQHTLTPVPNESNYLVLYGGRMFDKNDHDNETLVSFPCLDYFYALNTVTMEWQLIGQHDPKYDRSNTAVNNNTNPRYGHSAVFVDQRLFVLSGYDTNNKKIPLNDSKVFRSSINSSSSFIEFVDELKETQNSVKTMAMGEFPQSTTEQDISRSKPRMIHQLLLPRQYQDSSSNDNNNTTPAIIVGCIVAITVLIGIVTLFVFQWKKKRNQAKIRRLFNTPHTADDGDVDGFTAEHKHLFFKNDHPRHHPCNDGVKSRTLSYAQIMQPPHTYTYEDYYERRPSLQYMYGIEKPDGHLHNDESGYAYDINDNSNSTSSGRSSIDNEEESNVTLASKNIVLQPVKPDGSFTP